LLLLPTSSLVTRKLVSKGSQLCLRAPASCNTFPPFPNFLSSFFFFFDVDAFSNTAVAATVYCCCMYLLLAERAKQGKKRIGITERVETCYGCSNRLVDKMLSEGIIQCGKFRLLFFSANQKHTARVCINAKLGSSSRKALFTSKKSFLSLKFFPFLLPNESPLQVDNKFYF